MAELTITTFLSLDGVMQAPGRPDEDPSGGFAHGGWVFPYFDEGSGNIMNEIYLQADAFLLGRVTYDIFAGYWPKVTDPSDPIATALNSLPKYVASRKQTEFSWKGTAGIRDVVKEVAALKKLYPREVQVHGSGGLAQTLIENDLLDEYRLLTFPVILGGGKRLFGAGTIPAAFTLVRSNTTEKGVVISVYRRVGSLKTGSFVAPDSSGQPPAER